MTLYTLEVEAIQWIGGDDQLADIQAWLTARGATGRLIPEQPEWVDADGNGQAAQPAMIAVISDMAGTTVVDGGWIVCGPCGCYAETAADFTGKYTAA